MWSGVPCPEVGLHGGEGGGGRGGRGRREQFAKEHDQFSRSLPGCYICQVFHVLPMAGQPQPA